MKRNVAAALKAQGFAPRTMLDVGAHVGTFSLEFVDAFPECVPTLVEPNPHCGEALAKTGFETHLVAASDVNGSGELFLTKEWLQSTGSSLYRENTAFFRDEVVVRQPIRKARLDDLLKDRQFDFVKIDTQGSELDVLRGGGEVLRRAQYILIEISLVNYNQGGASAEDVFAELERLGFHCTDVTEFHRLKGVKDGDLLQIDVLFEPRRLSKPSHLRAVQNVPGEDEIERLRAVAGGLAEAGNVGDALAILEHLHRIQGENVSVLRHLVRLLGREGRYLEAVRHLLTLKRLVPDPADVVADIQAQLPGAINKFNDCANAGDIAGADAFASTFAKLVPGNEALVNAALSCSIALGKMDQAAFHAQSLLRMDPAHQAARRFLDSRSVPEVPVGFDTRVQALLSPLLGQHPLIRLRDLYDLTGEILCGTIDEKSTEQARKLIQAAERLVVEVSPGTELAGWLKHYRLAFQALDLPMMLGPTPEARPDSMQAFVSGAGKSMDWDGVRKLADRQGAQAVFFAAADENYVDLYARWYVKSILKHCDVPFIVVVHVIGGRSRLKAIAKSLGISDERLVLSGDDFDAGTVQTACYDTPPKGLIAKPVAHFQSVRFQNLGALVSKLGRPVFVSDIDLLLQRGVSDLVECCSDADVVFNENLGNTNPGSRLTANLVLVRPTDNTQMMLRFLQAYLTKALGGAEVSRWIDQFGLVMARHHLRRHGAEPKIGYFDTATDINNVMYRSYEKNPFRFLSLYHGFDTSTLEPDEGHDAEAGRSERRKRRKAS
jgi:FkbM family methyltransferase